jgi:CCR4-NOT transcription complex subunit 3
MAENALISQQQQQQIIQQVDSPPLLQQQQLKTQQLNEQLQLAQQLQQHPVLANLMSQQKSTNIVDTTNRLGIQIPHHQQQQQQQQQQLGSPTSILLAQQQAQLLQQVSANQLQQSNQETFISPTLGVAPLGKVPLNKEQTQQLSILEATIKKLPVPTDTERIRSYLPRRPTITPSIFPVTPLVGHDTLEFLAKVHSETLFFMFYYMEVRSE